ncbi:MAG: OmpA family protein [Flavobacteriales bacterium]
MNVAKRIALTAVALCMAIVFHAQSATKKADQQFENKAYYEAAKLYQNAEPSAKNLEDKARIFFQLGECYRLVNDYQNSLQWYEKAITAQYDKTNVEVYFNYGQSLLEMGKWDESVAQFNKYKNKGGEKSKADMKIKAAQDAATKKASKTKIVVENQAELNSPFFDYAMTYSSKKSDQIVFTTSRQETVGSFVDPITGESFMDLFYSEKAPTKKDKECMEGPKWQVPKPLEGDINSMNNEGACTFNKDFSEVFYTFCKYESDKAWFACDIMHARKQGEKWIEVTNLNLIDRSVDDTSVVGHPFLTADEKYLLFASDMAGGKGGKDLWYVTYDAKTGSIGKPVNMSSVNTRGDELFPYISDDGTLYFASNGHPGMGGLDIYKAAKSGDMQFAGATAMDYPINTSSNDFGLIMEPKKSGCSIVSGFFTSDRPGGKGKDDIYRFSEPPIELTLTIDVYDQDNGQTINGASVTLTGTSSSGDPINVKVTTDGNGGCSFDKSQILPNYTYSIEVQKEKYLAKIEKLSTVGFSTSTNFAREIFLIPIPDIAQGGKSLEMPEVRYDFAKFSLQVNAEVNSKDSLNYLYDILVANPTIVVELESHTDTRGGDKENMTLSQNRSKSCVDYLVKEKGIDPNRIVAVGKGETTARVLQRDMGAFKKGDTLTDDFINKLATEELRERAHQLNRRTMFRIIRTDYVPTNK